MEARLTDASNALALDAQYYAGISEGVRLWEGHVAIPHLYSLSSGFAAGIFEYTLPSYIRAPFILQIKTAVFGLMGVQINTDDTVDWIDVAGYEIEPTAAGGWNIRLQSYPYAEDGRIQWFSSNGPVPATIPTLTSGITSSDTSIALTVTSAPDLNDSGYVKIENEYLAYGGLTRTSTTSYTLLNCVRGLYGSTAASHNSATSCTWCVAADDMKLWIQLLDYVSAYAHALQLHKATAEDSSRHEKLMSFYQSRADNFWKLHGYVSQRKPRLVLTQRGLGAMPWG